MHDSGRPHLETGKEIKMRHIKNHISVILMAALCALCLLTACGPVRTEGTSASASDPVWTETDQ